MRTDEELLIAAETDPRALGEFYDRHERAVVRYFATRTRDRETAVDLAAETFAQVVVHCRRGVSVENALAWLFTIARNKLIDYERHARASEAARRRLGIERILATDDELEAINQLSVEDAITEVASGAALSDDQQAALVARHVGGLTYEEIADGAGVSTAVARQRVSRALAVLRGQIRSPRR